MPCWVRVHVVWVFLVFVRKGPPTLWPWQGVTPMTVRLHLSAPHRPQEVRHPQHKEETLVASNAGGSVSFPPWRSDKTLIRFSNYRGFDQNASKTSKLISRNHINATFIKLLGLWMALGATSPEVLVSFVVRFNMIIFSPQTLFQASVAPHILVLFSSAID